MDKLILIDGNNIIYRAFLRCPADEYSRATDKCGVRIYNDAASIN